MCVSWYSVWASLLIRPSEEAKPPVWFFEFCSCHITCFCSKFCVFVFLFVFVSSCHLCFRPPPPSWRRGRKEMSVGKEEPLGAWRPNRSSSRWSRRWAAWSPRVLVRATHGTPRPPSRTRKSRTGIGTTNHSIFSFTTSRPCRPTKPSRRRNCTGRTCRNCTGRNCSWRTWGSHNSSRRRTRRGREAPLGSLRCFASAHRRRR